MKKIILLSFLLITGTCFSQDDSEKTKEDYDLFICGGSHIGFWTLIFNYNEDNFQWKDLPYNVHIDKVFKKKFALGLGYTYDAYSKNPFTVYSSSISSSRQNIRIRFYKYMTDYEKTFSIYMGLSTGVSYWKISRTSYDVRDVEQYWPTAQFLFGLKVKLSETFFWQTEFGAGPPYALQTSLGIKF